MKPLTSSKENPNPYNVKDFLKPDHSAPDLSKLLNLVDIFFKYAPKEDQSINSRLIDFLGHLTDPSSPKIISSWANKQLLVLKCKNCKNALSDFTVSQYPLCSLCYNQLKSSSTCLYCLIAYNDRSLPIPCNHICIFCCNMHLKKGKKTREVCSDLFESVTSLINNFELTCSKCNVKKSLSIEPFTRLQCSHSLCSHCIKICISEKKCPIDSSPIDSKTINISLEYISDTCYTCKTRKKRKKITFKTCCTAPLCLKCKKSRSKCPNCLTPIPPQIKSQY